MLYKQRMNGLVFLSRGQPPPPHELWSAWNASPSLLAPLVVTIFIYLWGVRNAWRKAGAGHGIAARRCLYFLGAILALAAALVSPLDALSDELFSAHMIQHMILIFIAAPLLVMSDAPLALIWALPRGWAQTLVRRWNHMPALPRIWRALSSPFSAWVLFTFALWTWHAPPLFEGALRDESLHALEHLIFLSTAMLFWWVLLRRSGPGYLRYGAAVPYLFTTILQSSVLGALMTFTSLPWYPYYAARTPAWGLTPLQDQQLAGLIMWIPGGIVFTLLTIGYFAAWLRAMEQRSEG